MLDDASQPAAPPETILIVDDSAANRLAFRSLLESLGHRIVEAGSGQEALDAAAREEVAVVVMDVRMPGLDGFATLERLRAEERTRHTPVIFVTGLMHAPADTERAYALGAVDFLIKPVDIAALRAKVSTFVALKRQAAALRRQDAIIRAREEDAAVARATSELKDVYIGILGHDLRNPLNAIMFAAASVAHGPLTEAQRTSLGRITRSATRMERLIRDVLDYTRGRLGSGLVLEPEPDVDLGEVAHSIADEFASPKGEGSIDVECEGDLRGSWDKSRIEQVLSNLLGNAVQHGKGGVRLGLRAGAGGVTVEVTNHGPPIPPERVPALFEPFRRGETSGSGLGLGLYIVREIVRAHGGTIDVRSDEVQGTTFTVRLPRSA